MTILELSKELGVTKQALRRYMTNEFRAEHVVYIRQIIHIDDEGANYLRAKMGYRPSVSAVTGNELPVNSQEFPATLPKTGNDSAHQMLDELLRQIKAKDDQISAMNGQIASLTVSLQNALETIQRQQAQLDAPPKTSILKRIFNKTSK